ncbi:hypothetical protein CHLNCDRAFT_136380 [Chlorella variabilis]|uniref:Transcription factor 25 n=1 Tax=Chlorella variabilis TaxID=554065 RepID=E1ZK89_CHLVA|nr:hypothetical protein CHLNCDRAFT_136380 [Chlorella variabilis]EFN53652.1 hypothetical protein CHLNCDRAFT_136380 [Chlorella variabilis]|eukprot:XP_005845754.1 hypothetical protein CHLNCDRAFT_136380 [Chlorella variabilis]
MDWRLHTFLPAASLRRLVAVQDDPDAAKEEEQPSSPEAAPPLPRPAAAAAGSTAKKRAAKKKKQAAKKRGGRGGGDADSDGSEAAGGDATAAKRDEEDLDAILRELNLQPSTSAAASSQQAAAGAAAAGGSRPLLAVNMRHLKAEEELKRMFGSRVVEEDDEEGGAGAYANASRRVRRLAARGLLKRAALKPGAIIMPHDTWPRFDGGICMEAQGATRDGKLQFGYVYSQAYQARASLPWCRGAGAAVQELYEEVQATFDPNNVAALLQSHPYHLDALLTMHDLYRSTGEQAYAEEMLERALYALEMAWHPSFSPAAASMHVPYEEPNAPLFTCLFRYMQGLSRRGLHRTALEVCKLLLALNGDDPLGALCTIDYLALRAGRYDFLYRLVEQYGGDSSAALLPNFVFSQALARWFQEQEASSGGKARGGGGGSGEAGGGSEPRPPSRELLVRAVLLYPEAVVRLQRVLQGKGVGRDLDWAAVLRQPLFAQASDGGSASLAHLLDIWVERQHLLWKAQPIQDWLRSACLHAATAPPSELPDGLAAADWACVREQAWPAGTENEYAHLRLHDFSDAVARLPAEEIHGWGGVGGGGVDVAALEAEMRALAQQIQERGPDLTDEEMRQQNPLAALLRSLLPWANLGQAPDYEAEDGGGDGGDGQQQQQQQQQPPG